MSHVAKGDIHAYLDGALGAYPEDAADRVRRHLDECEQCARSLAEEKDLRRVASEILSVTAEAPLDLAPFEELVARAAEDDTAPSLSAAPRFRTLRTAATIVVSLGAGWLARDLTGPARELASVSSADAERAQQLMVTRADRAVTPLRAQAEGRWAALDSLVPLAVPSEPAEFTADVASAVSGTGARSEVSDTQREGRAEAPADALPDADLDRRRAIGGAQTRDQQRGNEGGPEATARLAPTERLRLEPVVPAGLAKIRMAEEVAGDVSAEAVEDELAEADVDELFEGAPGVLALDEMRAGGRASSIVIPALPVRDVRWLGATDGFHSTVVVVQELEDGRIVELRLAAGDEARSAPRPAVEGPSERSAEERGAPLPAEGFFEERLRAGWNRVVREVEGGVASIRGPLSEAELTALLDQALGSR